MGKIEKLIAKLKARSSAISFEEAEVLLEHFGYQRSDKGRTSGSRVMFVRKESDLKILLHKPHPRKELPEYQRKQLLEHLEQEGFL
ncbi:MAG: type II toxin-antitoxin system HicA family toxin [Lachnospiraceae bacterium]|nr:type II toxin-antitoxin system HicA family toxin [Lachnospiraceae bacterium]